MRSRLADGTVLDKVAGAEMSIPRDTVSKKGRDVHAIGVLDGGQTMRDGDSRATLGGLVERCLYNLLGSRVQSGRGLIEKQNLGIAKKGTSDGDAFYSES